MTIFINTPTGNTGRVLVQTLVAAKQKVTVLARDPSKVAEFAAAGVNVIKGDVEDQAAIARAADGAKAMFWLTPPSYRPNFVSWAGQVANQAAKTAKQAGIDHAVVLSSVGAQSRTGIGPVASLALAEDAFAAEFTHVTMLRPAFFMENLLRDLDSIRSQGAIYNPIPTDVTMPMVATRDIAAKAAQVLTTNYNGKRVLGIHGASDVSYGQVATEISEAIGKPVKHVQVTIEQAEQAMLGMGMPAFMVELFVDMYRGSLAGRMNSAEPRTAETTTATTLRTFVRDTLRPQLM